MKVLIKIMRGSKVIITSLILLVLVTMFSWGYQLSQHYATGHSAWFGNTSLADTVTEYNATLEGERDENKM